MEAFERPFEGSDWNIGGLATRFWAGMFAVSGWNYHNCLVEEMSNPKRDSNIMLLMN